MYVEARVMMVLAYIRVTVQRLSLVGLTTALPDLVVLGAVVTFAAGEYLVGGDVGLGSTDGVDCFAGDFATCGCCFAA